MIEWKGFYSNRPGEGRPVDGEVRYMLRCGQTYEGLANHLYWNHTGGDFDIIEYEPLCSGS